MFLFYLSADSTLSNIWRHLSEAMKSSSVGQRLVFGARAISPLRYKCDKDVSDRGRIKAAPHWRFSPTLRSSGVRPECDVYVKVAPEPLGSPGVSGAIT